MAEAIYRVYRPKTFADVAGQDHVKQTLLNQIERDTVAHAYLFSGPRGVGKTTLARLLAKSVNCKNRSGSEACGECVPCVAFQEGRTLDIIEIDAASHTGVDNVRENVIEAVRVPPSIGAKKVFIIDEVHMLSTSAFNALLKTLEEPPEHAIFVLATTEIHKIPQTILSRCQRFDFQRLHPDVMKQRLIWVAKQEGVSVDEAVLNAIVRVSEGCLRDAESLLGQLFALGEKEITIEVASLILPVTYTSTALDLLEALVAKDIPTCFSVLQSFVFQGGTVSHFIDELLSIVRELLFLQLGSEAIRYDAATQNRLQAIMQKTHHGQSRWLLDALLAAKTKPKSDIFPQLPLELVCVEFIEKFGDGNVATVKETVQEEKSGASDGSQEKGKESEVQENESEVKGDKGAPDTPDSVDDAPSQEDASEVAGAEDVVHPPVSEMTEVDEDTFVQDLQKKWKRCCKVVSERNVALPLVLQKARPLTFKEGFVQVGFEHSFHVDTVSQPKNATILADAISEVMQVDVKVQAVLEKTPSDDPVDTLVEAFGGSVID